MRITSLRGPFPRHCNCGNTASFEEILQRWRAVGKTVFNLTGLSLNLRLPTPEANALPLDQLADYMITWFELFQN